MNGFIRTFVFAMALLGMLLVGALFGLLFMLNRSETWREAARSALLSGDEQRLLEEAAARRHEPPRVPAPRSVDLERLTMEISDQLGRGQIRQLVEELRAKQAAVDDLRAHLQREEAEIRLARADLLRVQRQIQESERNLAEERAEMQRSQEEFARIQLQSEQAIRSLNAHEQERYRELATIYEAMRNDAWIQLRQMEADEIAKILAFMQERRAANILALAAQDRDYPGISMEIHRALLVLDVEGRTRNQIQRLADLYGLMSAPVVLSHLRDSPAEEVAALLLAMSNRPRLVGEVLQLLHRNNDPRELEIQRLMSRADVAGGRP